MNKLSAVIVALMIVASTYSQSTLSVKELKKRGSESFASRDYDAAIRDFSEVIRLTSRLKGDDRIHSNSFSGGSAAAVGRTCYHAG